MEKENSTSSNSFRYLMVFYLVLAVYTIVLGFLGWPKLKENSSNNRLMEHYQLWKSKENVLQEEDVPVYLHTYAGDTVITRHISIGRKDPLHYTLEALLQPLSGEELLKGYVSLIPTGTKLLGAAYSEGYVFVVLSEEFQGAEDRDAALEQMKKTLSLSFDTESLVVVCGDERYTR